MISDFDLGEGGGEKEKTQHPFLFLLSSSEIDTDVAAFSIPPPLHLSPRNPFFRTECPKVYTLLELSFWAELHFSGAPCSFGAKSPSVLVLHDFECPAGERGGKTSMCHTAEPHHSRPLSCVRGGKEERPKNLSLYHASPCAQGGSEIQQRQR